jgi:hypothetical protein
MELYAVAVIVDDAYLLSDRRRGWRAHLFRAFGLTVCKLGFLIPDLIGCERMWDPSIAAHDVENGKILAEVNYDVSQFPSGIHLSANIGWLCEFFFTLVGSVKGSSIVIHRGDSSGEVTIFDHICG